MGFVPVGKEKVAFGILCAVFVVSALGVITVHKLAGDPFSLFYPNPSPQQSSADPPSISLLEKFGTDQNDLQGYEGHGWGSAMPVEAYKIEASEISAPFEKAVGPSGENINGFFLPSKTPPDIEEYGFNSQAGAYGYYKGKLAYVDVHLKGTWQDAAKQLNEKFGTYDEVSQRSYGDGDQPLMGSHMNYRGAMWKRGKTNTRIYLMAELSEDGTESGLELLYVPNQYLHQIRNDWRERDQADANARASAQASREKENSVSNSQQIQ